MSNTELAQTFDRIADLLEITGEGRFRVNSYRRVARTISELADDVSDVAEEGRLADLPGIGKSTVEKINEYLITGQIGLLIDLETSLPEGLPDLLRIPGMGPKKVALVHTELAVGSMVDLKAVIEDGRLAKLPGLGAKSVERIAEGIEFLEKSGGRTRLGVALPLAEELLEQVRAIRGVRRADSAGSLRRGKETIGDVDILCEGPNGKAIVQAFTTLPSVSRVLAAGETKGSVTVLARDGGELQVDLRVVAADSFGAALQYFTGSKEHNVRLRELAVKRKLRLNEYGLFDGDHRIAGSHEADVYAALDLTCPPPELREDRGEFEAALAERKLIEHGDLRGDLHMHTTASDGRNTIDEMARAARERGYAYVAICDHSRSSAIANGLSVERLLEHIEAVRAADRRLKGIQILAGTECDILPDGSLDYPDEVLAQCDVVVASIHSAMGKGGKRKRSPTERTLAAIENRWVTVIGHPTGRLINERAAMEMDMGAIVGAAAANHTALELNASWKRLDLKDSHLRVAREAGVKVVINTDAHSTGGLDQMRFGVLTARRAALSPDDVINTRRLADLRAWVARKRGAP